MAKRRRSKMTVAKIMALKPNQIDKMSTTKLKDLTTILNSAANKRIKRGGKLGTVSEVMEKAKTAGRFTTSRIPKNMDHEKARSIAMAEFMRVRAFLSKETSSTRGVKKTQKKVLKRFIKKAQKISIIPEPSTGILPWFLDLKPMDEQKVNELVWKSVDKLSEEKPLTKEMRYRAANKAYEMVTGRERVSDKDSLFKMLESWASQDYDNALQEFEDVGDDELAAAFEDFTGI